MRSLACLAFLVTGLNAAPIQWSGNGHWYELVTSPTVLWGTARQNALNSQFMGMNGYLATITSQAEMDFLIANFAFSTGISGNLGGAWVGGSDEAVEGVWQWVDGPEAGQVFFSNGTSLGYTNWFPGEPNNCCGNEDHLMLFANGGWNDLFPANLNYIVEYNATTVIPEPSSLALAGLALSVILARRYKSSQ